MLSYVSRRESQLLKFRIARQLPRSVRAIAEALGCAQVHSLVCLRESFLSCAEKRHLIGLSLCFKALHSEAIAWPLFDDCVCDNSGRLSTSGPLTRKFQR